ncbi:MAG TPA: nuclear transport factor 2 family protein [Dermatophilaceae bacterium]|nr:nuclear transport factor 2 family protein [Dermatophilaceae bacterium]
MQDHKATVQRYLQGFRDSDHAAVLDCLTDDVVWDIYGFTQVRGKEGFDGAIEHEDFQSRPRVTAERFVEEGDTVVAIGRVLSARKDDTELDAVFCDVFTFDGDLISRVESYVVPSGGAP